ncbi:P22 phage major capsid protein family protein [Nocardia sp. CA-084685]|uniref:P22 phage major capsid protein family protein n=1 Tax=Nocardia sp. CA-084685 TaxID=3239970 RepID=UPI003D97558B
MELPPGADVYTVEYKGLSMRVAMDYDIRHKTTAVSVDTLYGVTCLDPPALSCSRAPTPPPHPPRIRLFIVDGS